MVVVGDALLDVDLVGRAGRISPDAPVPVLDELRELRRPGGAALAAALAARDGTEVVLVTSLAADERAEALADLLTDHGVTVLAARHQGVTTVKRRVRAGGRRHGGARRGRDRGRARSRLAGRAGGSASTSCVGSPSSA